MWEDPRVQRREGKIRSGIYAPLLVHDRTVGVLSAHRAEQRAFTESDLSLLTIVARYLTGAIEIARLHANLYDLAATDALTRLGNRRNFLSRLASEIARSRRGGYTLSIVVLDLDGFGIINDVHGHATGDALLIHVAQTLTRSLRASDLAARLGSDEFGLLLPETNGSEAAKLIARLKTLVISIPRQRQASSRVSLSYGIATWSKDGQTPDSLLQEAESQLQAMKHRLPKKAAKKARGREVTVARR
jgi:diguanylate cyclase (GGDEF)-like protein